VKLNSHNRGPGATVMKAPQYFYRLIIGGISGEIVFQKAEFFFAI